MSKDIDHQLTASTTSHMTASFGSIDSLATMSVSVGAACTGTQGSVRVLLVLRMIRLPSPAFVPATVHGTASLLVGIVGSGP